MGMEKTVHNFMKIAAKIVKFSSPFIVMSKKKQNKTKKQKKRKKKTKEKNKHRLQNETKQNMSALE